MCEKIPSQRFFCLLARAATRLLTITFLVGVCPQFSYGNSARLLRTISASNTHSLYLLRDGTVMAAGRNVRGQLGDGTTVTRLSPVRVPTLDQIIAVEAGGEYSVALRSDGTVWAWGAFSQLPNPTPQPVPSQITGLPQVTAVAVSPTHVLALAYDGTVWAWGFNSYGELGDGTLIDRPAPVQVVGLTEVKAIAAGGTGVGQHSLALRADGTVWSWGYGAYGQLGHGGYVESYSLPAQVSGLTNVKAIAAGSYHSMAVRADGGTVWQWGATVTGVTVQGNAIYSYPTTPQQVAVVTNAKTVGAGDGSSYALLANGEMRSWGANNSGKLGQGTTTVSVSPAPVVGLTNVEAFDAGDSHVTAVRSDGTVFTWGSNNQRQLADGTAVNRSSPVPITSLDDYVQVAHIAAGSFHTLSLAAERRVLACGANGSGQLGNQSNINGARLVLVSDLPNVIDLAAGGSHSLALKSDGTVWAWGLNNNGQLGDGFQANRNYRVPVAGGLTNIVSVAGGTTHSLALRADGTVWAWGDNSSRQLGDGTTTMRLTPVPVSSIANAVAIAAGDNFSLALLSDGTVRSWGKNDIGQLGDGTTSTQTGIRTALNLSNIKALAATSAGNHALALRANGNVWAWGYNFRGQLADGSTTNRPTPFQSATLSNSVGIGLGFMASYSIKPDGGCKAAGYNAFGGLGNGTVVDSSAAVNVSNLAEVVAVVGGHNHSIAMRGSGNLSSWGENGSGQLSSGQPAGVGVYRTTPSIARGFTRPVRKGFDPSDPSFSKSLMERSDDGFTHPFPQMDRPDDGFPYIAEGDAVTIPFGFSINFFGSSKAAAFLNNNGNMTFDHAVTTYTPGHITGSDSQMIGAFWGDVDTRISAVTLPTTYGSTTVGIRAAFAQAWTKCNYYVSGGNSLEDRLNVFQTVIINRSDVAIGDFDLEFNYNQVEWETGDRSNGTNGLGGKSARVGISLNRFQGFELTGSGVNGALLDSHDVNGLTLRSWGSPLAGRYLFQFRSGVLVGAPVVDAGPDQTLPAAQNTTTMQATATSTRPLTYLWQQLSIDGLQLYTGPDIAVFSNPAVRQPVVTLPVSGTYRFRLTVSDGVIEVADSVEVVLEFP